MSVLRPYFFITINLYKCEAALSLPRKSYAEREQNSEPSSAWCSRGLSQPRQSEREREIEEKELTAFWVLLYLGCFKTRHEKLTVLRDCVSITGPCQTKVAPAARVQRLNKKAARNVNALREAFGSGSCTP